VLLVQAAELAALFSRTTTCDGEVLNQKKDMNALRDQMDMFKTDQEIVRKTLEKIEMIIAGIFIRNRLI